MLLINSFFSSTLRSLRKLILELLYLSNWYFLNWNAIWLTWDYLTKGHLKNTASEIQSTQKCHKISVIWLGKKGTLNENEIELFLRDTSYNSPCYLLVSILLCICCFLEKGNPSKINKFDEKHKGHQYISSWKIILLQQNISKVRAYSHRASTLKSALTLSMDITNYNCTIHTCRVMLAMTLENEFQTIEIDLRCAQKRQLTQRHSVNRPWKSRTYIYCFPFEKVNDNLP